MIFTVTSGDKNHLEADTIEASDTEPSRVWNSSNRAWVEVGDGEDNKKRSVSNTDSTPAVAFLPKVALGYVPCVFVLGLILSFGSNGYAGYYLFVYSGMLLFVLFPVYTVYLFFHTRARYRNQTLTMYVALYHLISLVVPLGLLFMVLGFNGLV